MMMRMKNLDQGSYFAVQIVRIRGIKDVDVVVAVARAKVITTANEQVIIH